MTPAIKSADFVASYVNYYVCNGAVISANFGDRETDREAARVLAALYPGREIVSLNVDPIGETRRRHPLRHTTAASWLNVMAIKLSNRARIMLSRFGQLSACSCALLRQDQAAS